MEYKIIEKEAFKIIGKGKRISTKGGKHQQLIPEYWDEAESNGLCAKLGEFAGELGLLGVCMDYSQEAEEFTYYIAIKKPEVYVLGDLVERGVPSATLVIFESVGPMPGAIQKVWEYVFFNWFPASEYEHADAPELEVYLPGDPSAQDYKCEVWVPVLKIA
jgi:AraC family transcriptional regulator